MDITTYFKFFFALVFVLALMGGLAYILKRLGFSQDGISAHNKSKDKRLKIVETLPLDARRKAVLIQRDDQEHLVILSASGETVVETNIKAPKKVEK